MEGGSVEGERRGTNFSNSSQHVDNSSRRETWWAWLGAGFPFNASLLCSTSSTREWSEVMASTFDLPVQTA